MASLIYTIPDNKVAEFKLGFLKRCPNDEMVLSDPDDPQSELVQKYTDNEWIKEWGRRAFLREYINGKRKILAEGDANIDEDIVY